VNAETSIFFAYPSQPPHRRETVARAAARIDKFGGLAALPWENLSVGGRIVIREVLNAIERCTAGVFEITGLNENVLFELGYAIGSRKRVLPIRDTSFADDEARFRRVRILQDIGYSEYTNSDDVVAAFMRERPDLREESLFEEAIEPVLAAPADPSIFYVTSAYNSDASAALTRRVKAETREGLRLFLVDPREMDNQSLPWYAQHVHDAAAVVLHFESPMRLDADIHNPRCAFIGGLAYGMGKPILMLALDDYSPPFDYQDLLYVYSTAADCSTRANYWLGRELKGVKEYLARVDVARERRARSTELKTLRLGEPVAENEADTLDDYFIPTAAYQEALAEHTSVFVGRRGAGKSATMLETARALKEDQRNLVCTVNPTAYELEGLVRVLRKYRESDTRSYVVDAMWKFLLYSEIALAVVADTARRPAGLQPDGPEWELNVYLNGEGRDLRGDFDVRLERAIRRLEAASLGDTLEDERANIVEALHRDLLSNLRRLLEPVLANRSRVAILIDNLDKSWDVDADVEQLSYVLLGLLASAEGISNELRRGSPRRFPLPVTLGVFIRTDIYGHLLAIAREPDKIPVRRITWVEPQQLIDLIDARYAASAERDTEPGELWDRYFVNQIDGLNTQDYIVYRVLPKPRDILIFTRAAIDAAILRGSPTVEEQDIRTADEIYSQFAFDAIRIDDPSLVGRLDEGLIEFAGGPAILTHDDLVDLFQRIEIAQAEYDRAIDQLRDLSFLGIEIRDDDFDFSDDPQAKRRADVLAARLAKSRGVPKPRFQVHNAFRPYLAIQRTPEEARATPRPAV
jgi:hypothetical protein